MSSVSILVGFSALGKSHLLSELTSSYTVLDSLFQTLSKSRANQIQSRLLQNYFKKFETQIGLSIYPKADRIFKQQVKYMRLYTESLKFWVLKTNVNNSNNKFVINRGIEDYIAYALLYVAKPLEIIQQYKSLIHDLIVEWYNYVGLYKPNQIKFIHFDVNNVVNNYCKEYKSLFVNSPKRAEFIKRVNYATDNKLDNPCLIAKLFDDILESLLQITISPVIIKAYTPINKANLFDAYTERNKVIIQWLDKLS